MFRFFMKRSILAVLKVGNSADSTRMKPSRKMAVYSRYVTKVPQAARFFSKKLATEEAVAVTNTRSVALQSYLA